MALTTQFTKKKGDLRHRYEAIKTGASMAAYVLNYKLLEVVSRCHLEPREADLMVDSFNNLSGSLGLGEIPT